jgi:RNA polymerase sigma-70 factor (ECF subfamily)
MARDPLAQPEDAIRRLYAYVAYRIGPGPDAEDVVSETIERALRYRKSYDSRKGSPTAWLAGIASRVIADAGRAAARRDEVAPTSAPEELEDFSALSLRRLHLRSAMKLLDDRSRDLLALRYGADLKASDIGRALDMTTGATEVALHRALSRLRDILEDRPSDRDPGVDGQSDSPAPGERLREA